VLIGSFGLMTTLDCETVDFATSGSIYYFKPLDATPIVLIGSFGLMTTLDCETVDFATSVSIYYSGSDTSNWPSISSVS